MSATVSFVLDPGSPLFFGMLELLALACAFLATRAARKRSAARPGQPVPAASLGTRIVIYVGAVGIMGIILLSPGTSPPSHNIFLLGILPLGAWTVLSDLWWSRREKPDCD